MKNSVFALLALTLAAFFAGCSTADKLKVLIIGDSISYGYESSVSWQLRKVAEVQRISGSGRDTKFAIEMIEDWLGEEKWDLILFNWGLWDLCYRIPEPDKIGAKDKINGRQEVPVVQYKENLDSLVGILNLTGAKLVFVTTTYVPNDEPGMLTEDVPVYNKAAKDIMNKHSVTVLDIYDTSKEIHKIYGKGINNVHYTKRGYGLLGKHISDFLLDEIKVFD